MKYQDYAGALQADDAAARRPSDARLAAANINPSTGLASDYLNHFNEAIMLLEMLSSCPDCLDDFLGWRPMSYREHFEASRVKGRSLAIAAYEVRQPKPARRPRRFGQHHGRRIGGDPRGAEFR